MLSRRSSEFSWLSPSSYGKTESFGSLYLSIFQSRLSTLKFSNDSLSSRSRQISCSSLSIPFYILMDSSTLVRWCSSYIKASISRNRTYCCLEWGSFCLNWGWYRRYMKMGLALLILWYRTSLKDWSFLIMCLRSISEELWRSKSLRRVVFGEQFFIDCWDEMEISIE